MATLTEQIDESKVNLEFTTESPVDWYHSYSNYVKTKCKCCDKVFWHGYSENAEPWDWNHKNKMIWECYKDLVMHVTIRVRTQGDIKYIKLLIELFGNRLGRKLLKKYAERSIIVAKNITKYLNSPSKPKTNKTKYPHLQNYLLGKDSQSD